MEKEVLPFADNAQQADTTLPYAGIFKRLSAGIADLFFCYLLILAAIFVLGLLGVPSVYITVSAAIIFWLYFASYESSSARATPGKKSSRIIVTDACGAQISFARASLRCLGKLAILATAGLGLLVSVFDRQRRGLDDFIAGTRVHDVEAKAGSRPRPWGSHAVAPILLLAIIGLLAMIGIDAEKDYENKARISGLMRIVNTDLQMPYAKYYEANRRAPKASDLPFSHRFISAVEIETNGALVLRMIEPEKALLRMTPSIGEDGAVSWTCRVETKHPKLFPPDCRP